MLTVSFSQAIPGPVVLKPLPSNLYAGFKEEYTTYCESMLMQLKWNNMQNAPTEEELNYLLSLAENFGPCFL